MRAIIAVVGLAVFCACRHEPSAPSPGSNLNTSSVRSGSLVLHLETPAEVAVKTSARLKLTLTNTGNEPAQVTLGGRPAFDFVAVLNGVQIWRWSNEQAIQQILEMRTLKPGEEIEYEAEWELKDDGGHPVSPGMYVVRGVLNLDPPEKLETSAEMRITPR